MDEGRIKWFKQERNYGFIKRGGGKDDVFLHISAWQGTGTPREGQRVTFDVEKTPKGLQAVNATPVEDEGEFLNPYNFVRPLLKPRPEADVLGSAPPPPHDRYVDGLLTGRVTCRATAVTPLFISDSHAVREEADEHKAFRFFEYDSAPALPASSLRGMIRSVLEAATNSCFAVFEANRRLQYRERPRYGNRVKDNPGIVRQRAEKGGADGVIELCQVAQVGAYYGGRKSKKNVLGRKSNGQDWQTGERVVARAERRGRRWVARELAETKGALDPLESGEEHVEGWLKITGRGEDTNKRNEALFLDPALHEGQGKIRFDYSVQEEYEIVLKEQRELDETPVGKLPSERLQEGDLVWVDIENGSSKARRVVRVQVPRVPYKRTIGELLPDHLHRCTAYDSLCPACRLFGWVRQVEKGKALPPDIRTAYAGRVRLSHGELRESNGAFNATLAILSSPKPTNTQFYLLKNGKPDGAVDYDSPGAQLRGRKFYRHHGDEPSKHSGEKYEYQRVNGERDGQNRSVRNVLNAGAAFEFDVTFENLHPLELGALLWSLKLGKNMHHRLGYAKPLGFGSVRVSIAGLEILEPSERYRSFSDGGWEDRAADKELWIAMFIQRMREIYGREFSNVLGELHAILSAPPMEAIHYPRTTDEPTEEGENFKWFTGNTRVGGPHVPLGLAQEDKGLPLMDDRGGIQS